jgi:hypothetical protein
MKIENYEYIELLFTLIHDARIEHSKIIESIPIRDDRIHPNQIKEHRYPYDKNNLKLSDKIKQEVGDLSKVIGIEVLKKFFSKITDKVKIISKGHMYLDDKSFKEHYEFNGGILSERYINVHLSNRISGAVFNCPKGIESLSNKKMLEFFVFDCFSLIDLDTDKTLLIRGDTPEICHNCGEKIHYGLDLETLEIKCLPLLDKFSMKGKSTYRESKECTHKNGVGEHSIKLDIPSGKIVMANNLWRIIPKEVDDYEYNYIDFNDEEIKAKFPKSIIEKLTDSEGKVKVNSVGVGVNYAYGRVQKTNYCNQFNLLNFTGSNSVPCIFKKGNTIAVKKEHLYNSETDIEINNYTDDEKLVGSICMDIWMTNAMDYDLFVEYCKLKALCPEEVLKDVEATVLEIDKGEYQCINYYEVEDKYVKKGIFLTIQKL